MLHFTEGFVNTCRNAISTWNSMLSLAKYKVQLIDNNWIVPEVIVAAKIVGNTLKTMALLK